MTVRRWISGAIIELCDDDGTTRLTDDDETIILIDDDEASGAETNTWTAETAET